MRSTGCRSSFACLLYEKHINSCDVDRSDVPISYHDPHFPFYVLKFVHQYVFVKRLEMLYCKPNYPSILPQMHSNSVIII